MEGCGSGSEVCSCQEPLFQELMNGVAVASAAT